jgi:hypothetical protein
VNLESADDAEPVLNRVLGRGDWVDGRETGVERCVAFSIGEGFELGAEGFVSGGPRHHAVEEDSEVEAGASDHHDLFPAAGDVRNRGVGERSVASCGKGRLERVDEGDEVMRNGGEFSG